MAYASWSVVFGEQPSAAKWNILGTNDAGFNDGTAIGSDAITDAKLIYGKLRSRRGGSATNWQTTGTTNYDYSATNVFIQAGSAAMSASPTTVLFPTAFNQIPLVFAIQSIVVSKNVFVRITGQSTTQFSIQALDAADGATTTESCNWLAIGE